MKPERWTFDDRPGPVPEIRTDGDSVIFYLGVLSEQARLIVRCDPDGAIRASIAVVHPGVSEL